MLITVDPASAVPLFEQLVLSIRGAIVTGRVQPGTRLPAARELAQSLDINVHTVLRGYQVLRDEGLIELRRGRGAIVAADGTDYAALNAAVDALVRTARRQRVPVEALTTLIREAYR